MHIFERPRDDLLNYLTNLDDSKIREEKKELRIKIKQSEQKLSNLNLDIRQRFPKYSELLRYQPITIKGVEQFFKKNEA